MIDIPGADLYERYESQYTRSSDGQLIQVEKATRDLLERKFPITIDGQTGMVTEAVPATDEQGNIKHDEDGDVVPRLTTIFDAALQLFGEAEARRRIPILCHQHHQKPVGVCRVCTVLTERDGRPGDKLIPACQHPVNQAGMQIHTCESDKELRISGQKEPAGEYVRRQVKVLLELLAVNHLHRDQRAGERRYENELLAMVKRFKIPLTQGADLSLTLSETAFRRRTLIARDGARSVEGQGKQDLAVISYDPSNCILCDRCVRGCSETKPFKIIGHTGFGNRAVISFDLGKPMAESECVSCGECAVSCPTGALTFKKGVYERDASLSLPAPDPWDDEPLPVRPQTVRAEDLTSTANEQINRLFSGIPFAFLKWNEGAVGRLELPPVDLQACPECRKQGSVCSACQAKRELCREGQYGSTAFLMEKGTIEVCKGEPSVCLGERGPSDLIVGELACLNHLHRTATLRAGRQGATILVIKRNLLYMLRRNAHARKVLGPLYAERTLQNLFAGELFDGLDDSQSKFCIDFLKGRQAQWQQERQQWEREKQQPEQADPSQRQPAAPREQEQRDRDFDVRRPLLFLQVEPGQKIVRQGNRAEHFFIIYRGHVSVSETDPRGHAFVRDCLGWGRHFGEIGLLSDPEVSPRVSAAVPVANRGQRTADCIALDHVEVLRISKDAFLALLNAREDVKGHLEQRALGLLTGNRQVTQSIGAQLDPFTKAGLYQGQELMVLDLNRCTRCQECVKACAASHDEVTRVLLEGNRIGHYLVPSACRSCYDPYCLVGCPVDAIHRRPSGKGDQLMAIVIEDHCIGCGLCAHNCPYGSIHMADRRARVGGSPRIATNCNLCEEPELGFSPRCEKACPHDALVHIHGFELARLVGLQPKGPKE